MKYYPSITKEIRHDLNFYFFQKIDGSLIRAEWNSKKGFYKFGTKNELIDVNSKPFGISVKLIKDKYENDLSIIFKEQKYQSALCFFELWGKSSFAGSHNFEEKLNITLFDIMPYNQEILLPDQFIKLFGNLDVAKMLYHGKVNVELFDQIKQSTLPGMSEEGIVAKGSDDGKLVMFKVKSKFWLEKLKIYCKNDVNLFYKLE